MKEEEEKIEQLEPIVDNSKLYNVDWDKVKTIKDIKAILRQGTPSFRAVKENIPKEFFKYLKEIN